VHWLIGGDTLPQLPRWREFPRLLDEVNFVVMNRPDAPIRWNELDTTLQLLRQNVVTAPLVQISASEIRERVRHRLNIRLHTPPAVANFIADQKLYQSPVPAGG